MLNRTFAAQFAIADSSSASGDLLNRNLCQLADAGFRALWPFFVAGCRKKSLACGVFADNLKVGPSPGPARKFC